MQTDISIQQQQIIFNLPAIAAILMFIAHLCCDFVNIKQN